LSNTSEQAGKEKVKTGEEFGGTALLCRDDFVLTTEYVEELDEEDSPPKKLCN